MGKRFTYHDTKTLTNAEIKALVTTGITVVGAPGAGYMVLFVEAVVKVNATAGAYTNVDAAAKITMNLGTQVVSQTISEPANGGVTALFGASDTKVAVLAPKASPYFTLAEGTPNTIAANTDVASVETKTNLANKALVIKATNGSAGDFTGGHADNSATIEVIYMVIPV